MGHGTLTLMEERSRKECKYERSKVKISTRSQGSYWNITEFGIEGEGRDMIEREGVLFPSVLLCEVLRCPFRLMWGLAISYT